MTDNFSIIPLKKLLQIIFRQLDNGESLFGIPHALFFHPDHSDPFRSKRFDQLLETPFGVAAGPHTQLTQNIVAAWLTGARFIELKTIQTLDELNVSKPCINMGDEGYNCEWSQELKIKQSFDQYLNAWIIIHILKDKFNWGDEKDPGIIFNMSVGYDYAGILKENVQWFLEKMNNSSQELIQKIESITDIYPDVVNLEINPCISNNVTLSTMHGCPSDEIEKIGEYLLEEKKLHTAIKLNPTLIGKEKLHSILSKSGFETRVPDAAFEHDLKYEDAVNIIHNLQLKANENNLQFSLKLTNTLESLNHNNIFPSNEKMMYMSGRALHPISVNLADMLQNDFNGELDITFSAGVDAFNLSDVISCGLYPVTVCSDLLKPGGYGRLFQYVEELKSAFSNYEATSIDELIIMKSEMKDSNVRTGSLNNLKHYSSQTLKNKRYKKTAIHEPDIKTSRPLNYFDCIHAPCVDTCPTNQNIPDYMHFTAKGDFNSAFKVIMHTNPFPHTTGMICDHLCQTKCTRVNFDSPVLIREIKRFIAETGQTIHEKTDKKISAGLKAAIVGAGPSGLSCAYFLALAGLEVNIYETNPKPGGMVSAAIPSFRLTDEAIDLDIETIKKSGVNIHYRKTIDKIAFGQLSRDNDFVYIATGAQQSSKLHIKGIEARRVLDPLDFLFNVKEKKPTGLGTHVVIIGGGNTAMDAARTAYRLVGEQGKVTIIYRRTIKQMPADTGEIKAVMEEGIDIIELTAPLRVNTKNGKAISLSCCRMKLGEKDNSGRPSPVMIPDSEFNLNLDTVIPAIGQDLAIDFIDVSLLKTKSGFYETQIPGVFIGGDAMRGASTAINAIGDGRKAAQEIINKAGMKFDPALKNNRPHLTLSNHMVARAKKVNPVNINETSLLNRKNFKLVSSTLTEEEAIKEASRCLFCDEVCNICTTVCPNLAFHSYDTAPVNYKLQKIINKGGKYVIIEDNSFEINQKYQILHIADWCNECGNCSTFCPSSGSPYKDKPHLYLSKDAYNADDEGYYLENKEDELILYQKSKEKKSMLTLNNKMLSYKANGFLVILDQSTLRIIDFENTEKNSKGISLQNAAEMSIILQGAKSFFKHLTT
ncbi:MAG: putative selenate reductase subunit YgfK [Bacteroidales bacterium]|nr:putative selenate reductase subunit YgfK [Bacteroidales bacterium]